MEVHAHTHTPRKKWTHYLWEFLMLFLAVFCGFLAENMREHAVERNRAKELTTSLIRDLRKDTAELNRLAVFEQLQLKRLDTLIGLLRMPFTEIPQQDFYRLIRLSQVSFAFAAAKATTDQLKNAGYLRYFSKDSLSTLFSEYDFLIKDNEGQDGILTLEIYDKYYTLVMKTFDPELMYTQFSENQVPAGNGIGAIPPDELKQLKNLLVLMRRSRDSYLTIYDDLKNKAVEIMNYLGN